MLLSKINTFSFLLKLISYFPIISKIWEATGLLKEHKNVHGVDKI